MAFQAPARGTSLCSSAQRTPDANPCGLGKDSYLGSEARPTDIGLLGGFLLGTVERNAWIATRLDAPESFLQLAGKHFLCSDRAAHVDDLRLGVEAHEIVVGEHYEWFVNHSSRTCHRAHYRAIARRRSVTKVTRPPSQR
jgi:hypothetical protein